MTQSYVIHEHEVHFGVAYNIDHFSDKGEVYSTPLKSGELYVHKGIIYIGSHDKWYTVDIKDIKEFISQNEKKKLELHFETFKVCLYTEEYPHLNALRDILFIVQNKIPDVEA
jgi:hypothetical protein